MNINKAIIAPIVAVVFLCLKNVSGFEFEDKDLDIVVNAIMAILTLIGIFTHPVKKKDETNDM